MKPASIPRSVAHGRRGGRLSKACFHGSAVAQRVLRRSLRIYLRWSDSGPWPDDLKGPRSQRVGWDAPRVDRDYEEHLEQTLGSDRSTRPIHGRCPAQWASLQVNGMQAGL